MQDSKEKQCLIFVRNNANDTADRIEAYAKKSGMNYFTEYKDIKELTRDVVVKLISEVRVSENKEIEIVFDFDDCYKKLLESVEKLGYQVDKEPGGQLNISRREAV